MCYAPLVGPPPAPRLHEEEAAFQLLLLQMLGVRCTAERVGMLAWRSTGGAQLASVVECAVSSTAGDLLTLLNGSTQAATLACDALRHDMLLAPAAAETQRGLVTQVIRFLAGYGMYVSLSTDRTVCRLLDAWQRHQYGDHQRLLDPYEEQSFQAAASLCRVGAIANSLRRAIHWIRHHGVTAAQWEHQRSVWENALDAGGGRGSIDPAVCVQVARIAAAQSRQDWRTEMSMFQVDESAAVPAEDWTDQAWEDPQSHAADARSTAMDRSRQL